MKLGIKDGKIWDICSKLESKRTDFNLPDKDYIDLSKGDWVVGDIINPDGSGHLKDSPQRFEEKPKSKLELLQEEMIELKNRLKILEGK